MLIQSKKIKNKIALEAFCGTTRVHSRSWRSKTPAGAQTLLRVSGRARSCSFVVQEEAWVLRELWPSFMLHRHYRIAWRPFMILLPWGKAGREGRGSYCLIPSGGGGRGGGRAWWLRLRRQPKAPSVLGRHEVVEGPWQGNGWRRLGLGSIAAAMPGDGKGHGRREGEEWR